MKKPIVFNLAGLGVLVAAAWSGRLQGLEVALDFAIGISACTLLLLAVKVLKGSRSRKQQAGAYTK